MNSINQQINHKNYQFPFARDHKLFLKQGEDLSARFWGWPLNELITLESNEIDGVLLDKTTIPIITDEIYRILISDTADKINIQNSEIKVFVYNLCRLDDIVLFLVWDIRTELAYDDDKDLTYVKCTPFVFCHFFNQENQSVSDFMKKSLFNVPISKIFTLTPRANRVYFSYGGVDDPTSILVRDVYDSIVFEKTNDEVIEYNFKNFISDSLHTCFYYQESIETILCLKQEHFKKRQNRLLYVSIYL